MMILYRLKSYTSLIALALMLASILGCKEDIVSIETVRGEIEMTSDDLLKTLGEAYIFGYPMVLMDMTQSVATNVPRQLTDRPLAPINQLGHSRSLPDHRSKLVVKPNLDTYYSIAWLDLSGEPLVFSMPATDRYYLIPFLDAYSNVYASPGTRTTGGEALTLFISGPNWSGKVPESMIHIQSPTTMSWLLGRVQVNSMEDGDTVVKAIQEQMSLRPYSEYGNEDYEALQGRVNEDYIGLVPVKGVSELSTKEFFNRMTTLMKNNEPRLGDSIIIRKMEKIGIVAGQKFDLTSDNLIVRTKMELLPGYIHKEFESNRNNPEASTMVNGWSYPTSQIGEYGIEYTRRAYIGYIGLGANIPEDAVYLSAKYDDNGDRLDSGKSYRMHFDADQLPPVNAFWSMTAYNDEDFLVENEINRFALGDRDNLIYNEDGSLDLYFQHHAPSEEYEANWLPIPQSGVFTPILRLYWPKEEVLSGNWKPPGMEVMAEE